MHHVRKAQRPTMLWIARPARETTQPPAHFRAGLAMPQHLARANTQSVPAGVALASHQTDRGRKGARQASRPLVWQWQKTLNLVFLICLKEDLWSDYCEKRTMDPASLPLPLARGGRGLPTHAAALGDARRGAARRDAGQSCSSAGHSI